MAAVLADLGFRDHNLGPNCPIEVRSLAARKYRARIAWLALRIRPDAETTMRGVNDFAAQMAAAGGTLVMGGQGAPTVQARLGLVQVHSMAELAAFARGVQVGAPAQPPSQ